MATSRRSYLGENDQATVRLAAYTSTRHSWPRDSFAIHTLIAEPCAGKTSVRCRGAAKPRRSRANLRPRSRPASVIYRLLKNQNALENRNNLRSSSPHACPGQTPGEPRRNFAVRKFFHTGAMAVPIAGVRFGHHISLFEIASLKWGKPQLSRCPPPASQDNR
jgi:hypothetical protein